MKRYATCGWWRKTAVCSATSDSALTSAAACLKDLPNEEPGGAGGGWILRRRTMVTQSENANALMRADEDWRRAQCVERYVGDRVESIARDRRVVNSDEVRSPRAPP